MRPNSTTAQHDPYADNILVQGLGPIRSRKQIANLLTELPPRPPTNIAAIPRHIRLHMLMALRDLHMPSLEGLQLHESVDLMVRQNYRYLDPAVTVVEFLGVGGIEGDPKKDELSVHIFGLLGTIQPAQGPVYSQRQVYRVSVADQPVALLECRVV